MSASVSLLPDFDRLLPSDSGETEIEEDSVSESSDGAPQPGAFQHGAAPRGNVGHDVVSPAPAPDFQTSTDDIRPISNLPEARADPADCRLTKRENESVEGSSVFRAPNQSAIDEQLYAQVFEDEIEDYDDDDDDYVDCDEEDFGDDKRVQNHDHASSSDADSTETGFSHVTGTSAETARAENVIGDNNVFHVNSPSSASSLPTQLPLSEFLSCNISPGHVLQDSLRQNRKNELEIISRNLLQRNMILIHGPPGIGKTELAKQAAVDSQRSFHRRFIFHVLHKENTERVAEAICAFVFHEKPKDQQSARCCHNVAKDPLVKYLFILDGCERLLGDSKEEENFRFFLDSLVSSGNVKLILTSTDIPVKSLNAAEWPLRPLNNNLAEKWLRSEGLTDEDRIRAIVEKAQGNPLFLFILRRADEGMKIRDFQELNWAFGQFSESEKEILALCSVFDGEFAKSDIFRVATASSADYNDAVIDAICAKLEKLGIVLGSVRLSVHNFVRECVKGSRTLSPKVERWSKTVFDFFLKELKRIALHSWTKNGLSEAIVSFMKDWSFFDQVFRELSRDTLAGDSMSLSVLIEAFSAQEWLLPKFFMFLEYVIPFDRILKVAEGIGSKSKNWLELNQDQIIAGEELPVVRNIFVASLSYCNEFLRRNNPGGKVDNIKNAKKFLYKIAPVYKEKKNLLLEHPCAPYVVSYFLYADARSHSVSPKFRRLTLKLFSQALVKLEQWSPTDSEAQRHKDLDEWEFQMCQLKEESKSLPQGDTCEFCDASLGVEMAKNKTFDAKCQCYKKNDFKVLRKLQKLRNKFVDSLGDHEQTATAYKRLGDFYMDRQTYSPALLVFKESVKIMNKLKHVGGPSSSPNTDQAEDFMEVDWPQTILLKNHDGLCTLYSYFAVNKWASGLEDMEKAYELAVRYFPRSDQFWILKVSKDLADVYAFYGKKEKKASYFKCSVEYAEKGLHVCRTHAPSYKERRKHLENLKEKIEGFLSELTQQNL